MAMRGLMPASEASSSVAEDRVQEGTKPCCAGPPVARAPDPGETRMIKRSNSKYQARGPNIDRHSYKATIGVDIITDPC